MKDANDLLLAGVNICDIPTVDINIYCAEQVLIKYPDRQQQYKAIDKYIRTVSNELVKSDIAVILAKHWEKDVQEVRKQLAIKAEATDEKLADFSDIYGCFAALDETLEQEEIGIGYPSVDANIKLRKKWCCILGAYSYSGKTNNLIEFILHWCIRLHRRVLFFSMEMPKEDVIEVIIGKIIGIPEYDVRNYIKSPKGAEVYRQVAEKIGKYLYIIDKNGLSMDDINDYINLANTRVFDKPVDIVCVDYFGYLKGVSTTEQESDAAKKMKAIAKSNNVVFFMLAQFNKASQFDNKQAKAPKEPMSNDLKGAMEIYASSDVAIFIWRPALMGGLSEIDREKVKYETLLKIAKARKGLRKGRTHFKLKYDPDTGRLSEC